METRALTRRAAARTTPAFLLLILMMLAQTGAPIIASAADANTMTDPHDEDREEFCLDCHTDEINTRICDAELNWCLSADSIDELCLGCHGVEDCCAIGASHITNVFIGHNTHPSNIYVDEVAPAHRPNTLPVHAEVISCHTCHLHQRAKPADYKLLRLVEISGPDVDYTPLCADCHDEYL